MKPAILWDMDGTINRCAEYYVKCTEDFVTFKHLRTGLPKEVLHELVTKIDIASTKLPKAFARNRFPKSFEAASLAADILAHREPSVHEAKFSHDIGDEVFSAEYRLYDGAKEILHKYRESGWTMVLVTKGDTEVQLSKIKKNGLTEYFEHQHIVEQKSVDVFSEIVAMADIDPASSWMIGDSLRDDIAPAKALGLKTVHVTGGHSWEYDHHDVRPDHMIVSIKELTDIIPLHQRV